MSSSITTNINSKLRENQFTMMVKHGVILATRASVILSVVFTTKSSTTGEIYSMYHLAVQGRVSLNNSLSGLSSSMQILI